MKKLKMFAIIMAMVVPFIGAVASGSQNLDGISNGAWSGDCSASLAVDNANCQDMSTGTTCFILGTSDQAFVTNTACGHPLKYQ